MNRWIVWLSQHYNITSDRPDAKMPVTFFKSFPSHLLQLSSKLLFLLMLLTTYLSSCTPPLFHILHEIMLSFYVLALSALAAFLTSLRFTLYCLHFSIQITIILLKKFVLRKTLPCSNADSIL